MGESLQLLVDKTYPLTLSLLHPGDDMLTIFDVYPYELPEPILLLPDTEQSYITLKMSARTEEWNATDNKLNSKMMIPRIIQTK